MPIYEYHCRHCQKDYEIIRKFSDKPLKICPACGGKLEKKLSLSGFHLKGSGWYKDGYSSPKPEKVPATSTDKSPEKSAEKPTPSSSTKSEKGKGKTS